MKSTLTYEDFIKNGNKISFDPHSQFNATKKQLADGCGFLLPWAVEGLMHGEKFLEALRNRYGFPDYEFDENSTVDEEGVHHYPGDPPLHPYMEMESKEEILRIYPYAIVAVTNKETNNTVITRMD